MIPSIGKNGLLPPGIWETYLDEIEVHFCWNQHRRFLMDGLRRFLIIEWKETGIDAPIYIGGSFVTSTPTPTDIDIVMELSEVTDKFALAAALSLRFKYKESKGRYNVDAWIRHPSLKHDLVDFFQRVSTHEADKSMSNNTNQKGILKVMNP